MKRSPSCVHCLTAAVACALALLGHGCGETATPPTLPIADAAAEADAPQPIDRRGVTCSPREVAAVAPRPSLPLYRGVCSDGDVSTSVGCVFGLSSGDPCPAIAAREGNWGPCLDCLLTDVASDRYGAAIVSRGVASLNVGGCIQNFETAGDCGTRYGAFERCVLDACDTDCSPRTSALLYEACAVEAASSVCAKYADDCAKRLLAADGDAAECAVGLDFVDELIRYGRLFCGSPRDAGPD